MRLGDLKNASLYLDSNILILAIEPPAPEPSMNLLFAARDRRELRAVTSELTLTEILVRPLAEKVTSLVEKYTSLVTPDGPITGISVHREILLSAASLRASRGIKLADSIHLATAQALHCDFFLTFDQRLGQALTDKPPWLRPTDIVA